MKGVQKVRQQQQKVRQQQQQALSPICLAIQPGGSTVFLLVLTVTPVDVYHTIDGGIIGYKTSFVGSNGFRLLQLRTNDETRGKTE
ncbi:unnamed protein product [Anisakis simplex]|uniref:Uncharacterized protein n=1 Tax=Anisakis simplex TaxID=6269 RepID=A0A0M3J616_ANISI|nr:unnamed protein product [Anisakis simplex]